MVQQLADRGCHALAVHGGKAQQELPRLEKGVIDGWPRPVCWVKFPLFKSYLGRLVVVVGSFLLNVSCPMFWENGS